MFKGIQVKKYKNNRKLYAIELSKYINHKELAELFLEGRGIIVRTHDTNEDITVSSLVAALASVGHFDAQIKARNLSNIQRNLLDQGIYIDGNK